MKRAALLILVVGAPLVLIAFPDFRRRVAHKLRFLLLVWSGAVLFSGLLGKSGKKDFLEGNWAEGGVWPSLGMALFAVAFFSVLRDFRRSSPSRRSAKRR